MAIDQANRSIEVGKPASEEAVSPLRLASVVSGELLLTLPLLLKVCETMDGLYEQTFADTNRGRPKTFSIIGEGKAGEIVLKGRLAKDMAQKQWIHRTAKDVSDHRKAEAFTARRKFDEWQERGEHYEGDLPYIQSNHAEVNQSHDY